MNRKVLTISLSLLAVSAVVGSGFAAWFFGEETLDKSISGAVEVAPTLSGKLELTSASTETFKVVLDQGGVKNTEVEKGISFVDTTTNSLVSELKATYSFDTGDGLAALSQGGLAVTLTCTLTLPSELATYVDVQTSALVGGTVTSSATTYTVTEEITGSSVGTSWTVGLDTATTQEGVNSLLHYKTGQKPSTTAEYTAMKTAVNGKMITVSFSAHVHD